MIYTYSYLDYLSTWPLHEGKPNSELDAIARSWSIPALNFSGNKRRTELEAGHSYKRATCLPLRVSRIAVGVEESQVTALHNE